MGPMLPLLSQTNVLFVIWMVPVPDDHAETLGDIHGGQRDNKGRDRCHACQKAVDHAEGHAGRQSCQTGHRQRRLLFQKYRHDHARESADPADGQVQLVGQNGQERADGQNAEDRGLPCDVCEVVDARVIVNAEREDKQEQDDSVDGAGFWQVARQGFLCLHSCFPPAA